MHNYFSRLICAQNKFCSMYDIKGVFYMKGVKYKYYEYLLWIVADMESRFLAKQKIF